jgi:ribonucleoside-diphosphate reductase alpha chain
MELFSTSVPSTSSTKSKRNRINMPITIGVATKTKAKKALKIDRVFTRPDRHPFDEIKWETRRSVITNPDGSIVFEMNDAEVPAFWSQLATDIAVSKYFRKAGVPGTGHEVSAKQLITRVARTIRKEAQAQGGYFQSAADADAFEAELTHLLIHQKLAFNSPVWFNCGLWHEYGIETGGGNYYVDQSTHTLLETKTAYEHPQCSACFIQSVNDDLMSIFDLLKKEARIFKYGSGTGSNFSQIRGAMEKLSGGGLSSGLMSFLEVLDRGAGATKSGGTTRRAAKMVILNADHPEIEDFINWKLKEERKVAALIAAGYSADFNGEAYRTVAGQNSNNSVRVNDAFMRAVEEDGTWHTTLRTTGEVYKTYKARDLWNQIVSAAWGCADPGLQFDDTINSWHTCAGTDRIHGSNPCSEYMFLDDSACNLASINLLKFLRDDDSFDVEGYRQACRISIIAQEILVGLSSYPTPTIAQNSHDYRPLGLGYANLGALLMVLGLPYDSDEGRAYAAALTAIMCGEAYATSAQMAASKGAFAGYEKNASHMIGVIKKHRKAVDQISSQNVPAPLLQAATDAWNQALELGTKYGYRNAQATVLAPTGTIGLLMDCDTTGVEPDFSLVKFKKLAGGGYFKIVNQSVPRALKKLGYTPEQIQQIIEHANDNMTLEGAPHLKAEHLAVFDCANRCGNGSRFIAPMGHVRMMAAVQPFLSGAISKTVNVPHEATPADIADIYMQSWKLGLKAIAVYRDGCKLSQPLSSKGEKTSTESTTTTAPVGTMGTRKRLPKKRGGFTVEAKVAGHKVYLRTGEYEDGSLGEIFIDMHKEGATFRSLLNCFAISVSLGLQHGVPLDEFVDVFTFTRFEPQGMVDHPNIKSATSVVDFIFRVLGMEYLNRTDFVHVKPEDMAEKLGTTASGLAEENTNPGIRIVRPTTHTEDDVNAHLKSMMGDAPFCTNCGHTTVRNGACYKCLNCGTSIGCS